MLNDPLANALSNILNASLKGKSSCTTRPSSELIKKALEIMQAHKYIGKVEVVDESRGGCLKITLVQMLNACGAVKPRFSVKKGGFEKFEKRCLPAKDFGILIVSTSQGLMTHYEAKEKGLGGKLIAYAY